MVQFAKYMAGGGIYFWTGYGVFALAYSGLHWDWLYAKLLADVIGWTLNYLVQRYWAFASARQKLSEMQHVVRYLIIEIVGFILDYLMLGGMKAAGITPYVGFFVSSAFFTVWSYLWYKYWVFPEGADV